MQLKEKILEEFDKHISNYDMNDENIKRKYYHSIRVMEFADNIAKNEKMSSEMHELSIISGLLHDYARFKQWTIYHTYKDDKSIDHGDLAVELLFDKKDIKKFYVKEKNYQILSDSIKYHNKHTIPNNIKGNSLILSKIIRDADKLDIFDLLINNKNMFKNNDDEVSKKVEEDFFNHKCINKLDIKSDNDMIIETLALIYDINYKYSYDYIIKNNIIWRLYENINNKVIFKKYFDYIDEYINKRRIV